MDDELLQAATVGDVAAARAALDGGASIECTSTARARARPKRISRSDGSASASGQ
jgi:hypothetical protein